MLAFLISSFFAFNRVTGTAQFLSTGGFYGIGHNGIYALFFNPAGLSYCNYSEYLVSYSKWWGAHILCGGGAHPSKYGTIGWGIAGFGALGIPLAYSPSLPEEKYNLFYLLLYGAYSKKLKLGSFGLAFKLLNFNTVGTDEDVSLWYPYFDIGFIYDRTWQIGASILNIGAGSALTVAMGILYPDVIKSQNTSMDVGLGFNFYADAPPDFGLFQEFNIANTFFLRCGLKYIFAGKENSDLYGFGTDRFKIYAGFGFKRVNSGLNYVPVGHPQLGLIHRFDLIITPTPPEHLIALIQKREEEMYLKAARMFYETGLSLLQKGDLEGARQQFTLALLYVPDFKEASEKLKEIIEETRRRKIKAMLEHGKALYNAGEYLKAAKEFASVLEIDPENEEAKKLLDETNRALKKQTEAFSLEIQIRHQKAITYYTQGQYELAIKEWQELLKKQPDFEPAKEGIKKAKEALQKLITSYKNEARKYLSEGNINLALSKIKKAEELAPEDPEVKEIKNQIYAERSKIIKEKTNEGIRLYGEGKYDEAEAAFSAVLRLDPQNITAKNYINRIKTKRKKISAEKIREYYLKGISAYTKDDFEEAIYWWKKVLEIDPTNEKAKKAIERAKAQLERLKE